MISEYENKSEARHAEAECAEGAEEESVTVSAGRAPYMRYWRGVRNSKKCNPELAAKIRSGASLYDLWTECSEDLSCTPAPTKFEHGGSSD